jgi:ABC-2 type transport system permease protein
VNALHPALRLLLRHKLRGTLRKRLKRLRQPSGWLFALLGAALIGAWVLTILLPASRRGGPPLDPAQLQIAVQVACLVLTVLTVIGAFNHRGLYLPREEIEQLFAAPLSRKDLVRYRLLATVGRATVGAVVLALVAMRRMPVPALGALGVFLAAQTLPLLGQGLSILLGDAENRIAKHVTRLPLKAVQALLVVLVLVFFFTLWSSDAFVGAFESVGLSGLGALLDSKWVRWASAPFALWARLITAQSVGEFLLPLTLTLAVWWALFELVARLPVDYRELSLETSADVARQLNRRRRGGGGASASEAIQASAGWHVPWLFGRGPLGAVAWRKTCSILRKARGTVLTSLLIVGALTVASMAITRGEIDPTGLKGSLLIAVAGTLYLCAGLRFDFREDLDQMGTLKAWPVRPWRLFLGTLLPEVVLVSGLLAVAILVRATFLGVLGPHVVLVAAGIPVVVLLWAGIDNAVFLYMPVRHTPGQEGALHHAGRTLALLFLRLVAMAATAAGALSCVALHWLLSEVLEISSTIALWASVGLLAVVLGAEMCTVVAVGGALLRRFDVARDTG